MLNTHFLVVDPHPLFVDSLSSLLWQCRAKTVRCVVEYTEVIKLAKIQPGTVILFNMNTPGSKGAFGLDKILGNVNAKSVIAILENEDMALERFCIERGIGGIISKLHNPQQIKRVISAAMLGKSVDVHEIITLTDEDKDKARLYHQITTFTPKETQVFAHIKEGHLNKQIAHELEISEATIKFHVGNILRKLSCQNRTQAAVIANRHVFFS